MALTNKIFRLLPYPISREIVRRKVDLDRINLDKFEIKIAQTKHELEECFKIVQESYKDINIEKKDAPELRINKHHAMPTTTIIMISYENEIIGTVCIISSLRFKLPLEDNWNIDHIKSKGNTAEISSLAIKKSLEKKLEL